MSPVVAESFAEAAFRTLPGASRTLLVFAPVPGIGKDQIRLHLKWDFMLSINLPDRVVDFPPTPDRLVGPLLAQLIPAARCRKSSASTPKSFTSLLEHLGLRLD